MTPPDRLTGARKVAPLIPPRRHDVLVLATRGAGLGHMLTSALRRHDLAVGAWLLPRQISARYGRIQFQGALEQPAVASAWQKTPVVLSLWADRLVGTALDSAIRVMLRGGIEPEPRWLRLSPFTNCRFPVAAPLFIAGDRAFRTVATSRFLEDELPDPDPGTAADDVYARTLRVLLDEVPPVRAIDLRPQTPRPSPGRPRLACPTSATTTNERTPSP